jgi:hypothetical protein
MADGTRFGDWLFPFWLERQLDPTAAEYVPAASLAPTGSASGRRAWPGGLLSDPVDHRLNVRPESPVSYIFLKVHRDLITGFHKTKMP